MRRTFPHAAKVLSLQTIVDEWLPDFRTRIPWQHTYATGNFIETEQTLDGGKIDDIGPYLRSVDGVMLFNGRSPPEAVLLSEREVDALLHRLWRQPHAEHHKTPWQLVNLCYFRDHFRTPSSSLTPEPEEEPSEASAILLALPPRPTRWPRGSEYQNLTMLATIQLFGGDTAFPSAARRQALGHLLRTADSKRAALLPAKLRGQQHMVARSDLELVCSVGCDVEVGE